MTKLNTRDAAVAVLLLTCTLWGCTSKSTQFSQSARDSANAAVSAALAAADRSEADRKRDSSSKPGAVLSYLNIASGMQVLDLFAGGGYYSELLGRAVGSTGQVYMHNNAAFLKFADKPLTERMQSGRLQNVTRLDAELGQLNIPSQSLDMILMTMTYHDLYFRAEGWAPDADAFFAEIKTYLKPGGILAVIDHAAEPGSGSAAVQSLHRIDAGYAKQDITSRGFTFMDSSDLLRNPEDDHSVSVFDPAVRGKTDRFIQRFQLP